MDKSSANKKEGEGRGFMGTRSPCIKVLADEGGGASGIKEDELDNNIRHQQQEARNRIVTKDSNSSHPSTNSSNPPSEETTDHRRAFKDSIKEMKISSEDPYNRDSGGIVDIKMGPQIQRSSYASPHKLELGGEAMHSRPPSPAAGFPNRSPMKSDYHHDDASISLIAQPLGQLGSKSFESFPDVGVHQSESSDDHNNTPEQHSTNDGPPRRIDVKNGAETHEFSPIKFEPMIRRGPRPTSRSEEEPRSARVGARLHKNYRHSKPVDLIPAQNYGTAYPVDERAMESYLGGRYGDRGVRGGDPFFRNHSYISATSNPFYVLRLARTAFSSCTYKLPVLEEGEILPVNLSRYGNIHNYSDSARGRPDEEEVKIATRRVEAAICAFGGYPNSREREQRHPNSHIFRLPNNELYDEQFSRRFYVNNNHISWDLEENPPVAAHQDFRNSQKRSKVSTSGRNSPGSQRAGSHQKMEQDAAESSRPSPGSVVPIDHQQKMKYRCKLCGQPKQNHSCPYQKSLQRSIAVMVQPTVNAYTASEPGVLTKSLSEMNNFVSYDGREKQDSPTGAAYNYDGRINVTHVTPEALKNRPAYSPESSLGTHSAGGTPRQSHHSTRKRTFSSDNERSGRKKAHTQVPNPPFEATLNLRPEQYRVITPHSNSSLVAGQEGDEYTYNIVPLTFAERKRLSDTLFWLSKSIPTVTLDVAGLLRHARETNQWDLAVAELLAQVVVSIHCSEVDHTLEGLKQYLFDIGVSC